MVGSYHFAVYSINGYLSHEPKTEGKGCATLYEGVGGVKRDG